MNNKRTAGWLLALALLLTLAGCGEPAAPREQPSGPAARLRAADQTALVSEKERVRSLCFSGDRIYSINEEGYADTEDGDTYAWHVEYRLCSYALDGSDRRELPLPEPLPVPEGAEEESLSPYALFAGPEGTLYVLCGQTYSAILDPPETITLADGSSSPVPSWVYLSFLQQLDPDGRALNRIVLPEELQPYYYATDSRGRVYLSDGAGAIYIYSPAGELQQTLADSGYLFGMTRLADGSVAVQRGGVAGLELCPVDPEAGKLGKALALPESFHAQAYPGAFGYQVLVNNGTRLYGLTAEGERGDIAAWVDCDLDGNLLRDLLPGEDGESLLCLLSSDELGPFTDATLARLRPAGEGEDQRITLTLACLDLDREIAAQVRRFNRTNPEYRIEVLDYNSGRTAEDRSAGYERLVMELSAGRVPDLFVTSSTTGTLPVRTYVARGLLEDLWPYIDADKDLGGREALVQPVFDALTQQGGLYELPTGFYLSAIFGLREVVGEHEGWSMEEFYAAWERMPAGSSVLDPWIKREYAMNHALCMSSADFADRDSGQCSFSGEAFKDLVRFCELFPSEASAPGPTDYDRFERLLRREQMLIREFLVSFEDLGWLEDYLGGQVAYVGMPGAGGNGSCFHITGSVAMSASCRHKDAAWSFLRQLLDPDEQFRGHAEKLGMASGFPTSRVAFDRLLEMAMRVTLDAQGKPIPRGGRSAADGRIVPIYAMTEKQRDTLLALIEGTENVHYWDDAIIDIVQSEIGAYYNGDKSLDEVCENIQRRAEIYISEQQ